MAMSTTSLRLARRPSHSQIASLSTLHRLRALLTGQKTSVHSAPSSGAATKSKPLTTLQDANPRNLPEVWFNTTFPLANIAGPPLGSGDPKPDERRVKLGKTLRILQEHLPTLLQSPPPKEILAPNISLHLFPTTHPHLPVVSGRMAYIAALWTSSIAWNRVPGIGNVKLEILSERMVSESAASSRKRSQGAVGEHLVVRWRTIGKTKGWNLSFGFDGGRKPSAPRMQDGGDFTGLFIFEFDQEGRILSHTIENVEEGGHWERGVGAKVVELTDRLLGEIRGRKSGGSEEGPCPAFHLPPTDRRHG